MNKKRFRDVLQTVFCVVAGNALLAFLVAAFIIPHNIIMGGTTGIGIVLSGVLHFDTAAIVLIMNVVLLLIGLVILGKKFFLTTAASSILYPIMLAGFQKIPGIENLTDNSLTAAIFAGLLMGLSLGLVMRVGSSTGGMDVIDLILHKYLHLSVSFFVYLGDFIIIGGQALFSKSDEILNGIIVLILETILLEETMIFGKSKIQMFIISKENEEICTRLLNELDLGATMVMIETGRLEVQSKGVLCVLPRKKLYDAEELVQKIDPLAFTTITQIKEVRGRGFTRDRTVITSEGKVLTPEQAQEFEWQKKLKKQQNNKK